MLQSVSQVAQMTSQMPAKMCFGEAVARTLNGLRTNGDIGVPVERIREVAAKNGLDPTKLLNRVMGRRRAHMEYRDNRRWLVLNKPV